MTSVLSRDTARKLGLKDMLNKKTETIPLDYSALVVREPSDSEKRKYLELALVQEIEAHISKGLNINYITIDLGHGVDVRVVLNEATQTAKQTTGDDTEGE
jgi:hypothetical protein